ncbi:MAG: tRNA (adenosine(37)-N6)-threonylcarbamoyltransferase complex dimerization subunit type 1 TsaB [Gammaproteobacteria bacterium]|nr:tRNA (adenosine(37)-N6)-threonylcarbamoyltransferase complex dimerization subunit type 1 TsaB [Gammaproteobacteria bacterium]
MNILALETSSDACSIALMNRDKIIQRHEVLPQQHANIILDWIAVLLANANVIIPELDAIAYSCGPGSYTGIRIAAAVGQGIALAHKKPLIAVPSLRSMAQGIYREFGKQKVMLILNARMGQAYCGFYAVGANDLMVEQHADVLCSLADIDLSPIDNDQWVVVTDMRDEITLDLEIFSQVITQYYPKAQDTVYLAKSFIEQGRVPSLEAALPIYMRSENAWKKL